ncbi:hypothetical protein M878_16810 [Streptomyces roseochromogenus subsp. oscitans DS 12.976]|uniref:Uncharacterized protein n=1 Tax=Streptomyces roseochromogenus subsp. oscitans DS 12.976 TaxID=1352936 RepID=V6KIT8_STRRC|nr:hypothetical protein M878_16810 [Streptomyces roseochromogenus subsp. oscitans DS 12.976]
MVTPSVGAAGPFPAAHPMRRTADTGIDTLARNSRGFFPAGSGQRRDAHSSLAAGSFAVTRLGSEGVAYAVPGAGEGLLAVEVMGAGGQVQMALVVVDVLAGGDRDPPVGERPRTGG